jgi:hypothetical protein
MPHCCCCFCRLRFPLQSFMLSTWRVGQAMLLWQRHAGTNTCHRWGQQHLQQHVSYEAAPAAAPQMGCGSACNNTCSSDASAKSLPVLPAPHLIRCLCPIGSVADGFAKDEAQQWQHCRRFCRCCCCCPSSCVTCVFAGCRWSAALTFPVLLLQLLSRLLCLLQAVDLVPSADLMPCHAECPVATW